jgi:hypothetical protein
MTVTTRAEQHENFNRGRAGMACGEPDNANGRKTELGWARPLDMHRAITWTLCQPPAAAAAAMVVAVALVALTGCQRTEGPPAAVPKPPASTAQKSGTGALRSELEPLLKRFPLLGRPLSAQWMSGTLGDARVPGPSTYWIDAVLLLPPAHAAWLRGQYAVQAAVPPGTPEVVAALRPLLPAGPWERSAALDVALSQQGFSVKAYLSADRLVLVALGE